MSLLKKKKQQCKMADEMKQEVSCFYNILMYIKTDADDSQQGENAKEQKKKQRDESPAFHLNMS